MAFIVKLNNTELTHVTSVTLDLSLRAGADTRAPNALDITITREPGADKNADADQLVFKLAQGGDKAASIKPFTAEIVIIDEAAAGKPKVGTWTLGETFVRSYRLADHGQRLGEVIGLSSNNFSYSTEKGPPTKPIDILQRIQKFQ